MTPDENDFFIKKLLYKSKNRGCKETDLILGKFAEKHLAGMSKEQLQNFAKILAETDNDIYDWVTGKTPPPSELDSDIMQQLLKFDIYSK